MNASHAKRSVGELPWHYLLVVLVAGALFLFWELWYEKRDNLVIMPQGLRHNAAFIQGVVLSMVFFIGWTGLFLTYTLYLQEGLGMPAWAAGLMQMPIAIASGLASSWSGRFVTRWGAKLLVVTLLLTILGIGLLIVAAMMVPRPWIPYVMVLGMVIAGLGSGATVSPNNSLSLASVAKLTGSTAGAVLQTAQRVGSAIGLAVVTLIYYTALAHAKHICGLEADATALNSDSELVLPAYTTAFSLAMATIIAFLFLAWLSAWWGVWVEKKESSHTVAEKDVAEGTVRPEIP